MDLAALTAAGVYDPAAANAPERLRLLQWLEDRGATLADIVEANRAGLLLQLAAHLKLRPAPYLTLAESAARIEVQAFYRAPSGEPPGVCRPRAMDKHMCTRIAAKASRQTSQI